jgi:hypothetical protein
VRLKSYNMNAADCKLFRRRAHHGKQNDARDDWPRNRIPTRRALFAPARPGDVIDTSNSVAISFQRLKFPVKVIPLTGSSERQVTKQKGETDEANPHLNAASHSHFVRSQELQLQPDIG